MREQTWVTAVTMSNGWGTETIYIRTDKPTTFREWDRGILVQTDDEILIFVSYEHLVNVQFSVREDEDA